MSSVASSSVTILSGYITPLTSERRCRVALMDGEREYPILPRGAGIDLADMVSTHVEVKCSVEEDGEMQRLRVRSYLVLENEDEEWLDHV